MIFFIACRPDDPVQGPLQPFIDPEGNEYPIGRMCDGKIWMLKNLAVTRFRNGESIPYVYGDDWDDIPEDSAAQCVFHDSLVLLEDYGRLYNWYTVIDGRGLALEGWHVATDAEWKALINCNGGNTVAGDRLKEAGTEHWLSGTGTNESGFTALPGSRRLTVPAGELGIVAVWWTPDHSAECIDSRAVYHATYDSDPGTYSNCGDVRFGFSVRCVQD